MSQICYTDLFVCDIAFHRSHDERKFIISVRKHVLVFRQGTPAVDTETLRNSKKGAAIPHLNKELFYGLIIGIPPFQEQKRTVQQIELSAQLLK